MTRYELIEAKVKVAVPIASRANRLGELANFHYAQQYWRNYV